MEDNINKMETMPYDPETIRVDTKTFNIGLVNDMINDGDINLSPDFQRQFVWKDLGSRSRLIESVMLRIPLPVFYLAEDKNGKFHVVDGLQRLTVISQFLNNKFRLRDLEYIKDQEGKLFDKKDSSQCIDKRYQKRILQTQIVINVIDPQTPTNVKFDIFKRINQGGKPLNSQEIRNCMSFPKTRELLLFLKNSDEFLMATQNSVKSTRMQDQALILRFLAFRLEQMDNDYRYNGNMEKFLDSAVEILNDNLDIHSDLTKDFLQSMKNCYHLFGDFAFRKCLPIDLNPGAKRCFFNNALFTTWSIVLADFPSNEIIKKEKGLLAKKIADRFKNDSQYYDSVTNGTNNKCRLSYAFNVANELSKKYL